jgi:hypothetical protein
VHVSYCEQFPRYNYFTVQICYLCFQCWYLLFKWQLVQLHSTVHLRKFHRQNQCNQCEHIACCSSECILTPELQWPTEVHANSHASDIDAIRRQGRTILGAKIKRLYCEINLSRKPFGVQHISAKNCRSVKQLATRGNSSPDRVKNFRFSISSRLALGPPSLLSNGYWGLFPRG